MVFGGLIGFGSYEVFFGRGAHWGLRWFRPEAKREANTLLTTSGVEFLGVIVAEIRAAISGDFDRL